MVMLVVSKRWCAGSVYSVLEVMVGNFFVPYAAEKLSRLRASWQLSLTSNSQVGMSRFTHQGSLILAMQACSVVAPLIWVFLIDEACLRYYMLTVGDLDALVSFDYALKSV